MSRPGRTVPLPARGSRHWYALVILATAVAGWVSTRVFGDASLVPWSIATGVYTALFATAPRRSWPRLAAGAGATSIMAFLLAGGIWWLGMQYLSITLLSSLVGALVFTWRRRDVPAALGTPRDLLWLTLAAQISALLAGLVAAAGTAWTMGTEVSPLLAFLSVGAAQVSAVMVAAALLLPTATPRSRIRPAELTLQTLLLALSVAIVMGPSPHVAILSLPLPFLAWSAYRFGLHVTGWQLLLLASTVVACTSTGRGPFHPESGTFEYVNMMGATLSHGYIYTCVMVVLPVALAMVESRNLGMALREEQVLSEMTVNTAACLVLVTDTDGTLLRVNPAAAELLGVDAHTLVGAPAWHLVPSRHRTRAKKMFLAPDGTGLPASVEGRLVDSTGATRRVLWTTGAVRDNQDHVTHFVLTGLDVTNELNAAGHTQHLLRAPIDTAIVGIDKEGRITLVNSGAEAVLGRSSAQLVGTPFIGVLSGGELADWANGLKVRPDFASLLAAAVDAPPRDWHWLGDGTSTLVSMELSQITTDTGNLLGYLCVANDVTEARTRQELLMEALDKERQVVERLRELDVAKDHFVTTVSHEFRTPVATIVGYSEMLNSGELGGLTPEQTKALGAINRNSERLVALVDNLLALSGVTGEVISFEEDRERFNLVDVARDAEHAVGAMIGTRKLSVIFSFPGAPVMVEGEQRQLALVISNLMSNSIKFTEDGGEISCSVSRRDDRAILEVRDTGLGIPVEEQEHLFGRFWRSTTAVQRHIQGTGLGLATVHAIVAAHRGTIQIDSAHLAGTTVTVILPLAGGAAEALRAPRPERARRDRPNTQRVRRPGSPGLPELSRRAQMGRNPSHDNPGLD